jgi:hypothetical protein
MYKLSLTILILILLSGCCCPPSDMGSNTTVNSAGEKVEKVKVSGVTDVSGDFGSRTIIGYVENTSGSDLSSVYVKFTLYDKDKTVLGYTNDLVSGLKAGDKWKFKCMVMDEAVTSYEMSELTTY